MAASIASLPSLAFQPDEAVEKGFVRILEQLAGCAAVIAPRSPRKLADSVHNARVLIKRLRAYLWFAKPAFFIRIDAGEIVFPGSLPSPGRPA